MFKIMKFYHHKVVQCKNNVKKVRHRQVNFFSLNKMGKGMRHYVHYLVDKNQEEIQMQKFL